MSDCDIKTPKPVEILLFARSPRTLDELRGILPGEKYRASLVCPPERIPPQPTVPLPELILVDFSLEKTTAPEVCRHLKSAPETRDIPVIMLCSGNGNREMTDAFGAGASDCITRPFDPLEVLARIDARLSSERACRLREERLMDAEARAADLSRRLDEMRRSSDYLIGNLDRVDRVIHGETNVDKVMENIIETVLDIFGCDRAWLLYPCDPESKTWTIPMERTRSRFPGASALDREFPMTVDAARAMENVLSTDEPIRGIQNPGESLWDPKDRFGVRSYLFTAIRPKTGKPWKFGLHQCSHQREWTNNEIRLFKKIGLRIADAFSSKLLFRDLKESEEKLASTLASLDDLVLVLDNEGIFRDFHLPESRNDILAAPGGGLGKSFKDVIPPHALSPFEAAFKAVKKTGKARKFDYHMNLSGDFRWFTANFSNRRDGTGKCVGVTVVCRDITDRKLAEEALRDNEARYRAAIENSSDGIVMSDGGNFLFVNERILRIFDYNRPQELLGMPLITIVHPDDRERIARYNRHREEGLPAPERYEAKGITKAGKTVYFDLTAARVTYRDRQVTLAFIKDITRQKDLESQLTQSQKMEAIGTLAGGIAHDFNNILSAILGRAELALLPGMEDTDIRRHLKQILLSGNRATELVRQILAFSKRRKLERKPLKLSLLVEETLKMLRATLPSTIRFSQHFEDRDAMITANATQIHQVLMNLATNAAHAMRNNGGGELAVTLKNENLDSKAAFGSGTLKPGKYIKLSFSDTGHGMDRSMLDRIFDPYFSTKKQGEGTGLGLSVVHSIIKGCDGGIYVKSTPGKGTVFHIYLPRVDSGLDGSADAASGGKLLSGKGRILLVDDEEALISIETDMLEFLGYEVSATTSSLSALAMFENEPERFDLVITDLTMPELTGDQLAVRLLSVRLDIPVILCTGYGEKLTRNQAESMGIKKILLKPLSMDHLSAVIKEVLSQAEAPASREHDFNKT